MIDLQLDYSFSLPSLDGARMDSRLFQLLGGIAESGSLLRAARMTGLSYRHAWGLMETWRDRLGQPLAVFERGRGARLTPFGEKLLWADTHVRNELASRLPSLSEQLQAELEEAFAQVSLQLVVHASHDLALVALREFVKQQLSLELNLQFHGSVASLAALARGKVHLAGFHLGSSRGEHMLSEYRRLLQPRTHQLISFVTREQGLMVARGNPKGITSVAHLARGDVRFVNRQRGSGTRMELDRLLGQYGVSPAAVRGYEGEEFTHVAVAAMVATGVSDVGLGIRAAASQYQLDFIPLLRERYFFACRRAMLERTAVRELLGALRNPAFREIVSKLPGYSAEDAGTVCDVGAALGASAHDPSEV